MHRSIRSLACAGVLWLSCVAGTGAASSDAWPEFTTPADSTVETIAADMLLNGKPCRMVRFDVAGTDEEVATFYRTAFGPRHVENRLQGDRVIATRQGDYFVTVQLHTLDDRTVQGTVMTTLVAGAPVSSAALVDTRQVLPADSQIVSSVQTTDAMKRSLMLIGVNRNSVQANRDHVLDAMAERGFRLTTQSGPQVDDAKSVSLQLASPAEDASVTIDDAGPYRSVVINRIRDAK